MFKYRLESEDLPLFVQDIIKRGNWYEEYDDQLNRYVLRDISTGYTLDGDLLTLISRNGISYMVDTRTLTRVYQIGNSYIVQGYDPREEQLKQEISSYVARGFDIGCILTCVITVAILCSSCIGISALCARLSNYVEAEGKTNPAALEVTGPNIITQPENTIYAVHSQNVLADLYPSQIISPTN